jgi:cytochrome c peroxidase
VINRFAISIICIVAVCTLTVNACRKSDRASAGPQPLVFDVPAGFPQPHYSFSTMPLTEEGFQLGRKIFYDGRLSPDGTISCASCHEPIAAFGTFDHDLSHGFDNQHTTRNAPGLFNLAWHKQMRWDGGVNDIAAQSLSHIMAPNEMAEQMPKVVMKLSGDQEYRRMFRATFGDETVNSERILSALTQFVANMVSSNSRYDKMKRGDLTFTSAEQTGYEIFKSKCNSCHAEPLFTDLSFRNNGMELNPTIKDVGRMGVTGNSADSLKFKVPSLRNIMLTFPYGHDGRFIALSQVFTHYSEQIEESATLDPLLKDKLPLSALERQYLIEFLRTLTDSTFLLNPRYAKPQ